jgi:hypothetical protein
MAVVVLPTPPFWFAMAMIFPMFVEDLPQDGQTTYKDMKYSPPLQGYVPQKVPR